MFRSEDISPDTYNPSYDAECIAYNAHSSRIATPKLLAIRIALEERVDSDEGNNFTKNSVGIVLRNNDTGKITHKSALSSFSGGQSIHGEILGLSNVIAQELSIKKPNNQSYHDFILNNIAKFTNYSFTLFTERAPCENSGKFRQGITCHEFLQKLSDMRIQISVYYAIPRAVSSKGVRSPDNETVTLGMVLPIAISSLNADIHIPVINNCIKATINYAAGSHQVNTPPLSITFFKNNPVIWAQRNSLPCQILLPLGRMNINDQNLRTDEHQPGNYILQLNGNTPIAQDDLHNKSNIKLDNNAEEIEKLQARIVELEKENITLQVKNKTLETRNHEFEEKIKSLEEQTVTLEVEKEEIHLMKEKIEMKNTKLREKIQTLEEQSMPKHEKNEMSYQILESGIRNTSLQSVQVQSTQNENTEFQTVIQKNAKPQLEQKHAITNLNVSSSAKPIPDVTHKEEKKLSWATLTNQNQVIQEEKPQSVSSSTQSAPDVMMQFNSTRRGGSMKQMTSKNEQQGQDFMNAPRSEGNNQPRGRGNNQSRGRWNNQSRGRGNNQPRGRGK